MKIPTFVFGIVILLLLSSCAFYQPSLVDIPLIKGKNDLRVDAGVSANPSIYSTVSYGLTNQIALQAFAKRTNEGYYVQGALGLYKSLVDNFVVEWYNGVGYGNRDYYDGYRDMGASFIGTYRQFFSQLNYGKNGCRFANMDFGVGLKAGYIVADREYSYMDANKHIIFSSKENHSLLFEPHAFIRLGGKRVKFSTKVGYGMLFKLFDTDSNLPYDPLNLGIGLNYTF